MVIRKIAVLLTFWGYNPMIDSVLDFSTFFGFIRGPDGLGSCLADLQNKIFTCRKFTSWSLPR